MSDYDKIPDADTRDLTPVQDAERHRRVAAGSGAPFSRVSGNLHAADQAPVQGLPNTHQDPSRVRTVYADNEPLSDVRRPVQAEGYSERRHAQTDRTLFDSPERGQTASQRQRLMQRQQQEQRLMRSQEGRPESDGHRPVRRDPPGGKSKKPLIIALIVLVLAMAVLFLIIDPLHLNLFRRGGASSTTEAATAEPNTLQSEYRQDGSVVLRLTTDAEIDSVNLISKTDGRILVWSESPAEITEKEKLWEFELTEPYDGIVYAIVIKDGVRSHDSPELKLTVAGVERSVPTPVRQQTEGEGSPDETSVPAGPIVNAAVSADHTDGDAPLIVTFTALTDTSATGVRLIDRDGEAELDFPSEDAETDDGQITWTLEHTFEEPGFYRLGAIAQYDGEWIAFGEDIWIGVYGEDIEDTVIEDETVTLVTGNAGQTVPAGEQTPVPISNVLTVTPTPAPVESADPQDGTARAQTVTVTISPTDAPPIITQVPLDRSGATATPPPAPTDAPAETPVPAEDVTESKATPEPTAAPETTTAPRRIEIAAADSASPSQIKTTKIYSDKKKLTTYVRGAGDEVDLPDADHYLPRAYGVLTFRSSSFRQNAASGNIGSGELTGVKQIWQAQAGSAKGSGKTVYYGIGKGSQPAIVLWAWDVRAMTNIDGEKRDKTGLKEVIVAGDDGRIYFLDLDDGVQTRSPINLGVPMRGTPTVHSYGQPYMTVGQYARKMANRTYKIGLRTFNLLTQKEMSLIDGLDSDFKRTNRTIAKNNAIVGSFNTSALIDTNSDTLIAAGSNGLLYVTKLNASTDMNAKKLILNPSTVVFASQAAGEKAANVAVESSLAGYQNYVFYADKAGWLRCVDVNSMTVGWAVNTGDTVEAAVALDLDSEEHLWLYTANSLQLRSKGDVQIRRYDAETGKEVWSLSVPVVKPKKDAYIAGVIASPVIGTQGLDEYVYFTVSGLNAAGGDLLLGKNEAVPAALVCIEKATGRVRWAYALDSYSYSSPVAVYNDEGRGWIIQAESDGTMHIIDGISGAMVQSVTLEGAINGSPAVYRRILVIGTQGKNKSYIYGFEINPAE